MYRSGISEKQGRKKNCHFLSHLSLLMVLTAETDIHNNVVEPQAYTKTLTANVAYLL